MLSAGQRAPAARPHVDAAASGTLLNVVYRSQAVTPLPGIALHGLVAAAQARNNAESITGLVLYDDDRFYQWLEGSSESLGRVMSSINADARHTAVKVLASRTVADRAFRGWDMQLAARDRSGLPDRFDVIRPPARTIELLRSDPDRAPDLLARLAARHRAAVETTVEAEIVPRLLRGFGPPPGEPIRPEATPRVMDLASLVMSGRGDLVREAVEAARARTGGIVPLFASLIEPALRHMGDLWVEDLCRDVDLTIGVCTLGTAVHEVCRSSSLAMRDDFGAPRVLIAACPGEAHSVASVLEAEALWCEGWAPRIEFPRDQNELRQVVADGRFDCVVLGLSAVFAHRPGHEPVGMLIDRMRRSSGNPALAVVVSGRAVADRRGFAQRVGADAGSSTASRIADAVRQAVAARRRRALADCRGNS